MTGAAEELLNVYDALGRVAGAMPRREAKRSGLAVGAVAVAVWHVLPLSGRKSSDGHAPTGH